MNDWMVCHPVSRCYDQAVAYDQAPQWSLFVSGTSMQIAQMILTLKRSQKGRQKLFSETQYNATNRFY